MNVTLPKFQIHGATISLKQTLEALGMVDAFGGNADFSKMANEPLYVGDVCTNGRRRLTNPERKRPLRRP